MKVADLFAGVGGLSQGFIKAGFEISIAIEYDKDIALSYQKNHPNTDVYSSDIRDLNFKEIHKLHPDIQVVMGGPPCQGFSQKGKRLSLNDPRNFLFKEFVRFVEEFSPKYFVLENVPNIITTENGYFKDEIIQSFKNIGYDVCCGVLNAKDFGVPQDRKRAVFIGQKGILDIQLPEPTNVRNTIKDAIFDLPFIESGEGAEESTYDKKPISNLQKELRGNCIILHNHVATKHNPTALRRMAMVPIGERGKVLPKEEQTKSIYSGTYCRLLEDDVASTITTRFDTPSSGRFTHPRLNRCITTREAARIQTFPDNFVFFGSKTCQMKQVGNAVPPLLAYEIAKVIISNESI
ncbi:DNA cytosine methyltransferase [Lepagella muris]|uniref:DNA cytosine methyltransferase n=1 Tax=Lepagella muris TaxID=3032870 RepID=A0AC61RLE9_9BACT|nr:DNA cytosine methyltransferase [Lepagella muris]TGY79156.1 DNA cytosine methyltransferase [Lepagella muris]THG51475.1 DNA cytosine methyltransferase [Bacteroidales bacterium]TKC59418.1 DNA cytosine methyltransferase [Bacteroidales bacterium]